MEKMASGHDLPTYRKMEIMKIVVFALPSRFERAIENVFEIIIYNRSYVRDFCQVDTSRWNFVENEFVRIRTTLDLRLYRSLVIISLITMSLQIGISNISSILL